MTDERMDLTALEQTAVQRERALTLIMARARAELERRAGAAVTPIMILSQWARPALAAAAVVALVCGALLAQRETPTGPGLTDALNVPTPANEWLVAQRAPTASDVVLVLEGEER